MERLNARLRKIVKTRGHLPSADASTELVWLALRHINRSRVCAKHNWKSAMNQLAIRYENRYTKPGT